MAGFRKLRPGDVGAESEEDIYRKRSRRKAMEFEGPTEEETKGRWGVRGSGKAVRVPRWSVPSDKSKQMLQRRPKRRDEIEEDI